MAMSFLQRRLAKQLGDPSGLLGSLVVGKLNKRNHKTIVGAIAALGLEGGETVADIGYGGGIGLTLLLDEVGEAGRVHGVEPSQSMIERARKELSEYVASNRLVVHRAAMDALPFNDAALDGWISLNTIYFIEDLPGSFSELARVLNATGRGVLGVADPEWLSSQPFAAHGFIVRPISDIVTALEDVALRVSVQTMTDPESEVSYNLIVCSHAS